MGTFLELIFYACIFTILFMWGGASFEIANYSLEFLFIFPQVKLDKYRSFSHDVTAAMLVYKKRGMAAILVYKANPLGIELYFYANTFFLFH